jgi:hypothetical protein
MAKWIRGGATVLPSELTILAPEWSGPVSVFKVFTFEPGEDAVVRNCIDESYALQVLAA